MASNIKLLNEEFEMFAKSVSEFLKDDKISIKWGKETLAVKPNLSLKEEFPELYEKYKEKELVKTIFFIAYSLSELADDELGNDEEDEDNEKIQIIRNIYETDKELLEHIRVHSNSTVNTFNSIHYDINSRRRKFEPYKEFDASMILSIFYGNSLDPKETDRIVLELTKKELEEIVDVLQSGLEHMEKIKA